jgi:hypothetical protein
MFWAQGFSQAPWLVQRCVASWQHHNPRWRVVLLDAVSILDYVDPLDPALHLGLAHQSDLYRLQLLARYGGVWADATTLCRCPLDTWIDASCSCGFFAFHRPGRDRLIANWFLASQPGCVLVVRLYQMLHAYWQSHRFSSLTDRQHRCVRFLSAILNRSHLTTRFWFSPLVSRGLGFYPYFVFHYLFERLVANESSCQSIWKQMPRISAMPSRLIERLGFHAEATPALLIRVEQCPAPLFKLSWQYACDAGFENSLMTQVVLAGR